MVEWTEYVKFFAGVLSIVNPIGSIWIFINPTANQSRVKRQRTGSFAALTIVLVLGAVLVSGEALLRFFGINISSFRVGRALLIFPMSISMMHARLSPVRQTEEEAKDATERDSVAMVPLGIPLLGVLALSARSLCMPTMNPLSPITQFLRQRLAWSVRLSGFASAWPP
jgi:multiple antibiotic resistance protein